MPVNDPVGTVDDTERLLAGARAGDPACWDALVARHGSTLWAVARSFRLDAADAADVVQTSWLRLLEHLDAIREPERLGSWLATTARRESLRVLRHAGRQFPTEDTALDRVDPVAEPLDASLLRDERDAALWRALLTLSARCQQLLRILAADPPPTYEQVSAALGMPIGSIGPTRGRCLGRLRTAMAASPSGATGDGVASSVSAAAVDNRPSGITGGPGASSGQGDSPRRGGSAHG